MQTNPVAVAGVHTCISVRECVNDDENLTTEAQIENLLGVMEGDGTMDATREWQSHKTKKGKCIT